MLIVTGEQRRELSGGFRKTTNNRMEIMAAIARANEGCALAYGHDDWTGEVERRFAHMFECDVAVFLVATGTAANALQVVLPCDRE